MNRLDDPVERFSAGMEAVAFLERMGIDRLAQLGLSAGPVIFATGGAVAGATWMKIRASVNRRRYQMPKHPECAVGAAVLAATPSLGSYKAAAKAIIRTGLSVEADDRLSDQYDAHFEAFVSSLGERGYL